MPKNKANNFLMTFVSQTQMNLEPPNVIKKEHQVVGTSTLTRPHNQMAKQTNQMAERPNRPFWNRPLFDVNRTIFQYYQNHGRSWLWFDPLYVSDFKGRLSIKNSCGFSFRQGHQSGTMRQVRGKPLLINIDFGYTYPCSIGNVAKWLAQLSSIHFWISQFSFGGLINWVGWLAWSECKEWQLAKLLNTCRGWIQNLITGLWPL